jgi:hypothetical protein
LWDVASGQFIALNAYIRKNKEKGVKSMIKVTTLQNRERRTNKTQISQRKKIIKMRAEANEIGIRQ